MKLKFAMSAAVLALMLGAAPAIDAAEPVASTRQAEQQRFASPEAAAQALAEAVRREDVSALLSVVGPQARSWLFSGDRVSDRQDWKKFLAAYDRKHVVSPAPDGRQYLLVGDSEWPFPAPLIQQGNDWLFDAKAGREEILNRRIGENELSTIQTLLAIVDAQREYAAGDLDGNGSNDYAQRIMSSPGLRDGLYWPTAEGQSASPLGPLVGEAARDGYGLRATDAKLLPYRGYYYRLLKGQGKSAAGGAYSYLVNDRMIGGFAVLAYPAKHGASGVMSFLVNHEGTVYQKNLGKSTAKIARGMRLYSPDSGWKKAQ